MSRPAGLPGPLQWPSIFMTVLVFYSAHNFLACAAHFIANCIGNAAVFGGGASLRHVSQSLSLSLSLSLARAHSYVRFIFPVIYRARALERTMSTSSPFPPPLPSFFLFLSPSVQFVHRSPLSRHNYSTRTPLPTPKR